MASPPFNINQALPADNDIVSQHPGNARAFRDIVESWLLVNHDTNGNHAVITMPYQGSPPSTPAASLIKIYADVSGRLRMIFPDGTVQTVGLPPGAVVWTAKTTGIPNGFLLPDGSAVSRSTYADLFTELGITHGAGNGSTTFNLPDIRGRVVASEDGAAGRLTDAVAGFGDAMGEAGGLQIQSLSVAQIPTITSSGSNAITVTNSANHIYVSSSIDIFDQSDFSGSGTRAMGNTAFSAQPSTLSFTGTNSISVTTAGTNGLGHNNVQPTIVLRALIKT